MTSEVAIVLLSPKSLDVVKPRVHRRLSQTRITPSDAGRRHANRSPHSPVQDRLTRYYRSAIGRRRRRECLQRRQAGAGRRGAFPMPVRTRTCRTPTASAFVWAVGTGRVRCATRSPASRSRVRREWERAVSGGCGKGSAPLVDRRQHPHGNQPPRHPHPAASGYQLHLRHRRRARSIHDIVFAHKATRMALDEGFPCTATS